MGLQRVRGTGARRGFFLSLEEIVGSNTKLAAEILEIDRWQAEKTNFFYNLTSKVERLTI